MKVFSPKKHHELDLGVVLYIIGALLLLTVVLLPWAPQISQTVLIVGLSLVAVWAAVLGE